MTYQIFENKVKSPAIMIGRKQRCRFSLNSLAARIFHSRNVGFVLLLWNEQTFGVAMQLSTGEDSRAYKLTYGRVLNNQVSGASLSARSFLNHISWKTQTEKKTMPATWNNKGQILEFLLPMDCLELK